MSQGTTSRRRSTRQLQTCHQCRVRKVRCDGGPSACANCERLKFACSFARPRPRPGPEAEPPASSPGGREEPSSSDLVDPGRRRATRACAECRVQKTKCSGEAPSCASCVRRGRPCAYPESKRPLRIAATKPANDEGEQSSSSPSLGGRRSSVPVLPPDTAETCASVVCSLPSHTVESVACGGLPTIDQTLSLLRGFFRHIYPLVTYSFLHEPSVTQRCLQGTLEEALAYTICSIAAMRLRQGDFSPQVTDQWVERAEARIWEQIEHPTIFRLQALVLAIHYRMLTGRFQRAFMLSSLAARSASALRLNYEREDLSFLAQEIRRRLMWTLMYLDCYFSFGLPEFELCPYEVIYLSLPAREEDFNDETAELGEPHLGSRGRSVESGLYAFDIRIMTVRRDIMRLKRQVALSEQPMPQLAGLVEDFRKILLQIRSETPGSRLHALGEMEKVYASRWRQRYLIAHLSWHQCNCDLYRLFLRGYQEAAPEVVLQAVDLTYTSTAASLCLEHATAIIQIIYDFDRRSSDDDVVDYDIAICAYHAARIVAHTATRESAVVGHASSTEVAVGQASLCLSFLKRFFSNVALVLCMISDLEKTLRSLTAGEAEAEVEVDDDTAAFASSSSDSEEENVVPGGGSGGGGGQKKPPRLSRVAQDTQRLSVHCVVRQARFVDDSHDCASASSPSSSSSTTTHPPPRLVVMSPTAAHQQQQQQQQLPSPEMSLTSPAEVMGAQQTRTAAAAAAADEAQIMMADDGRRDWCADVGGAAAAAAAAAAMPPAGHELLGGGNGGGFENHQLIDPRLTPWMQTWANSGFEHDPDFI